MIWWNEISLFSIQTQTHKKLKEIALKFQVYVSHQEWIFIDSGQVSFFQFC
jgi:hypothetical protein